MTAIFSVQNDRGTVVAEQAVSTFTQDVGLPADFNDGDTFTIGTKVYTLNTVLGTSGTALAESVHLGGTFFQSAMNLCNAVNQTGGVLGVDYVNGLEDANVIVGSLPPTTDTDPNTNPIPPVGFPTKNANGTTTFTFTARNFGTAGNAIVMVYTPSGSAAGAFDSLTEMFNTMAGGVDEPNAYIDVVTFKRYHTDRGNAFSASDAAIQLAIVGATDYVERRFWKQWKGVRLLDIQTTAWPRENVQDDLGNEVNGIPRNLKYAVAEYALRALATPMFTDGTAVNQTDFTAGPVPRGRITSVQEQVGPIKTQTNYDITGILEPGSTALVPGYLFPRFPAADLLLEPLITSAGTSLRIVH